MNPALFLVALEEPGQSYQAEVPPTFIYIRCVGNETLSMKVQILFQERGARTENFPLSTQYWVITTDWGDKLRTSSFLRNPRELCDAN